MNKRLNCFLDGDALCIVKDDFVDLQESEAIFIKLNPFQLTTLQRLEEENNVI